MRIRIDVPSSVPDVFRALTDKASLERWLTEHARVSLADGVFELWGRYLPEAPSAAVTRLLHAEPDRGIRFAWHLRGEETVAAIELAAAGNGCRLTVTHKLPRPLTGEPGMNDFWALSLENLRRLLIGGSGPVFCDFCHTPRGKVELAVDIDGRPSQVYACLIDPVQLERYIATKATVDPVPGGRYDFGWGGGPIKILDIQPDKQLSYSWTWPAHKDDAGDTVVTWTLQGSGGRTRLTLVHSGFGRDRKCGDYFTGWIKFLNDIRSLVEMGETWINTQLEESEE